LPDSELIPDVKLTTVKAAAAALDVTEMTVCRLIRRGELKAIRLGRIVRIFEHSLKAYLQAHPCKISSGNLAAVIRRRISDEIYVYAVPDMRSLADEFDVPYSVIQRVIIDLETDGILYRKAPRGTFITSRMACLRSIAEVAQALEVGKTTVARLIEDGTLQEIRVARDLFIHEDQLRNYINVSRA
jgi:excisionase family DNA binding protein